MYKAKVGRVFQGGSWLSPCGGLVWLGLLLMPGCGGADDPDRLVEWDNKYVQRHLVCASLQVPGVIGATEDVTWDVAPLPKEELRDFLVTKLPAPDKVPPDAGPMDVLVKYAGKRLVVIPEEAGEILRRGLRISYKDLCSGHYDAGMSIGHCLQIMIETVAPVTGDTYELNPFVSGEDGTARPSVYVVLVTKRNLILLLIPRDIEDKNIEASGLKQ